MESKKIKIIKAKDKKNLRCLISIIFGIIILILLCFLFKNTNLEKKHIIIDNSEFPIGLLYHDSLCIEESIIQNINGDYNKVLYGTHCRYSNGKDSDYLLINNEIWKIISGDFVSIEFIDKKINNNIDKANEKKEEEEEIILKEPLLNNKIIETSIEEIQPKYSDYCYKPGDFAGNLKCDRLQLNANVVYGETQSIIDNNDICISSLPGTEIPIFCGGHSTKSFSVLKDAKVDDIFIFETNYGTYTYQVSKIATGRVLKENFTNKDFLKDIDTNEELFTKDGNEILQMYTCAYLDNTKPTPYRYAVIANLIDVKKQNKKLVL